MFKRFAAMMALVFAVAAMATVSNVGVADEKEKEEKLVGKITCAKCDLGTADKCQTVIKVGDKVYIFDEKAEKKYHKDICSAGKDGTVMGTVKKDGDKMIVTVKKLEYKK